MDFVENAHQTKFIVETDLGYWSVSKQCYVTEGIAESDIRTYNWFEMKDVMAECLEEICTKRLASFRIITIQPFKE